MEPGMMNDDNGNVVELPIRLRCYRLRPEEAIPRRPWIMRGLLLRRQVTAIVAAGGVGKSVFGLIIAMHLAAGLAFGPFKCENGPYKIAILSAEEDDDELDRRLAAIARLYNISNEDLGGRLFVVNTAKAPILAAANRAGNVNETPMLHELERLAALTDIDVVIIDPFIEIWLGIENDNGQVRGALGIIRDMIRRINAACLLTHHIRKGTIAPGDIDAARGASSLVGLVRFGFTLTNMSPADALEYGIDKPKDYLRIDNGKANYIPAAAHTHWFRFHDIELNNAAQPFPGDHVGVLKPWELPGPFQGISYELIDTTLGKIAAGLPNGERYAFAPQAKRYVGQLIAEVMEISEERASLIVKCWKKSGLLYEDEYKDSNYRLVNGVFVDITKRPSATAQS